MVLEKTFESPLDCKEVQLVHSKGILRTDYSLENSLEGLMLKLHYFGHLTRRADSLEKTMILGNIDSRRRRG